MSKENPTPLEAVVIEHIREVYDPEIPENIYDLGLVYEVTEQPGNGVHILMTLTSPACPVAMSLPRDVGVAAQEGINEFTGETKPIDPDASFVVQRKSERMTGARASVELTWDPPFEMSRIPLDVRLLLGL